ncbi:uncharacterized protein CBL_00964 [Carabus blaptoides fortunei]
MRWWTILFCTVLLLDTGGCLKTKRRLKATCGGTLTDMYGVIQTPGFPARFSVPIRCQWVIDVSNVPSNNATIVVYLTQLYVLKGLSFTEYAFYDSSSRIGERLIHTVTDRNVTKVRWLQPQTPFLVIDFHMKELEGNQLRALDGLLDVYGFNITYEISTKADPVRPKSCSVVDCSFVGHCYAARDLAEFWCSCFDGFSGPNCSHGPLCEEGRSICQNGATCSHMGANAVTCSCPPGFKGTNCGLQTGLVANVTDCGDVGCQSQCPFDGHHENICNCPKDPHTPTDRARFEGTIRLANLPAHKDTSQMSQGRSALVGILERQLAKYLKNSNLSKMDDLRVLNITAGAEVTFHFFGAKKDGSRVRDALNRLVERGRLGNLTFVPTHLAVHQEPTLLLQSVKVNRPKVIREGDEFIISCLAQGSSYMTFQWYKDGIFVNTSKAIRAMWTHLQSLDTRDLYTARLGVMKATSLDEGLFTCQVEDWGVQQCKSVHIEVRRPPEVEVVPKSVTVQKGDNVSIVCISPNDRRPDVFGYNWTKNKLLFKMKAGTEVWEELYPAGSILKITNVQKSALYSCEVIGYVTTTVDVRVEVLNKTVVPLCTEQTLMGIKWHETSPGVYSIKQCPPRFTGDARRLCTLRDVNDPEWDLPDFSTCFSESLIAIHNNFRRLAYGYQNTTGAATLQNYLHYLHTRSSLFPGEGERILNLVQEVITYINSTEAYDEVHNATRTLYRIVDFLLKQENSILDITKIAQLQRLLRSQQLMSGSLLKASSDMHDNLDTFTVDVAVLDSSTLHNLHIPLRRNSYPAWFGDKLDIHIESANNEPFGNGSFTVAIVAYKNLSSFLPARSVAQMRNGYDLEYEIISQLVTVSLGRERGRPLLPPPGTLWLDMELHHAPNNYSWDSWNTTCAVSDVAGSGNDWDMDACVTVSFNATLTRCTCMRLGTFAILLTTRPSYMTRTAVRASYQLVVLLGCVCCLVQSLVTMGVLLLYWWYHRSSLVYLKVQCCAATVGAMAVFTYALCNDLPRESFAYITTLLETFLLVGMSSHLSKLLIVYTELVQMSGVRRLKPTVVGIITGVPVIAIFGNHLAHRSIGQQLDSWWLLCGTLVFNIFVSSGAVMFVLFVFLYFNVMGKLHTLITKHITNRKALNKRIGLLRRSALIFMSMVVMVTASIVYVNETDIVWHYMFSTSSAVLGFLQLVCYVIKCENSLRTHLAKKLKFASSEDDFSSDSANSPLSFFTKQDPDAESESAPPRPTRGIAVGPLDNGARLLLSDSQCKLKYPPSEGAPSTIETYMHSISEDSVERYDLEVRPDGKEDVDLELYNSSPKIYRKSPIDAALYSESEKMYPEHWFIRGHPESLVIAPAPGQYLRDMAHPPDILTTRVCVELGLVPSVNPGVEANILVEAPSIVMCNVEVEPGALIDLPQSETTSLPSPRCNGGVSKDLDDNCAETKSSSSPPLIAVELDDIQERKQPDGREKSCQMNDIPSGSDDNLDGMLDRISLDLDYLLNRTIPEIHITPATLPVHVRKTSKLPASSVRGQIKEEDEQVDSAEENDSAMGIAKTAC